jgi:hypothetical protein
MPLNLDRYNQRVKDWTEEELRSFKTIGAAKGVRHREYSESPGPSLNKFKKRFREVDGAIEVIGINFPRQLIHSHYGSGKGRGGTKGSRWVDKYGQQKKTNPKSFGKMGTGGRTATNFITETLDAPDGVTKLADIVAEEIGDALIGNLFK